MRTFCLLVAAVLLAGCANPVGVLRERQNIPFRAYPETEKPAAIYLWPPYTSAAIVDTEGNRCVLTASGAQTIDANAQAAIKAGDLFGKIANLDASSQTQVLEAFKQISAPDNRSAALDIALFHLCLLDQNGTFSEKNMMAGRKGPLVLEAYKYTVERAFKMTK